MEKNEPKLVCRKCQGAHLTMNCGKESKSVIEKIIVESYNNDFKSSNYYKKNKDDIEKSNKNKYERKPLHKVKMSNLPFDITEDELNELLYNLYNGKYVVRMRLLNYENNSTAYIEFKEEEAADYIVEALHKTPFDHIMLDVERLYD